MSFGIKRIVVPDDEIKEHLSYSLLKQTLLQFKFNNWSDESGFRDEKKNKDYNSIVTNKENLKNWYLTDDYLTLSSPILDSDKSQKWNTIADYWNEIVPFLKDVALQQDKSMPLDELAKLCEERFEKNYRNVGVDEFYKIKKAEKKSIAKVVCQKIESDLFNQWKNGKIAINDIVEIFKELYAELQNKFNAIDENKIIEQIDKLTLNRQKILTEWSNVGLIQDKIFQMRKKMFESCVTTQKLYTEKTNLVAWDFAKEFLSEILNQLKSINSEVSFFDDLLNKMLVKVQQLYDNSCHYTASMEEQIKQAIVRVCNPDNVKDFEQKIIREYDIQKSVSTDIRNAIIEKTGAEPGFKKINNLPVLELFKILETLSYKHVSIIHNQIVKSRKDSIIDKNILEKLFEKYSDNTEALDKFIRNIVKQGGTFLNFNDAELSKKLKNNDAPKPGQNLKIETIVVSIPDVNFDKQFLNTIEESFKKAIGDTKTLLFDKPGNIKNEITIMSIINCFPLRAVSDISYLKEKNDLKLKQYNNDITKLVLHIEGDGKQYPSLFTESAEDKHKNQSVSAAIDRQKI